MPHSAPLPSKVCAECSIAFLPRRRSLYYKVKYCSKRCCQIGYRRRKREHWANNRDVYRAAQIRTRKRHKWRGNWWKALTRDNFTCRICGHVGGEKDIRKKRILVHHLDNEGENYNCNHDMENLMTVCYDCHKGLHGISLLFIDGRWQLSGKIFERLKLNIPTL